MSLQDTMNYYFKTQDPWIVTLGRIFYSNSFIEGIAAEATVNVLGITPTDRKVRFVNRSTDHTSNAHIRVELFEDVTVSANGTAADVFSYNRNIVNPAQFQIFSGPTITDFGMRIDDTILLGSGGPATANSSVSIPQIHRELKINSIYALSFTNHGTEAANISTFLAWYEEIFP